MHQLSHSQPPFPCRYSRNALSRWCLAPILIAIMDAYLCKLAAVAEVLQLLQNSNFIGHLQVLYLTLGT